MAQENTLTELAQEQVYPNSTNHRLVTVRMLKKLAELIEQFVDEASQASIVETKKIEFARSGDTELPNGNHIDIENAMLTDEFKQVGVHYVELQNQRKTVIIGHLLVSETQGGDKDQTLVLFISGRMVILYRRIAANFSDSSLLWSVNFAEQEINDVIDDLESRVAALENANA